jgi:hypothetical protein
VIKGKLATVSLCFALCLILLISGTPVGSTPDGATVEFTFNSSINELSVIINSPVGIGGGDIKLDVPADINIDTDQVAGFMDGAMYLSLDTIHRWFQISANGQTQGSLTVTISPSTNMSSSVTLVEVNLLDSAENIIPIETHLPWSLNLGQGPTSGSFTVLSPNGGEVLDALRYYPITWTVLDNVKKIDLAVSIDGGKNWREIAQEQANTGNFKWRAPNMNVNNCLIRLDAYDSAGNKMTDTSDAPFSVKRRAGGWFSCQ